MDSISFDITKLNKNDQLIYSRMNENEKKQFEALWLAIEEKRAKMQQLGNKSKVRYNREQTELNKKARAARTHRLIERGAILEQFIENAEKLDNEAILKILKETLATDYGKRKIQELAGENNYSSGN